MAEKRLGIFTMRLGDDEREAIEKAIPPGANKSTWVRERLLELARAAPVTEPRQASGRAVDVPRAVPVRRVLQIFHIDELGADGLRLDNGAMRQ